ncbi:MAG TPA: hypothetical protein DCE42_06495, partial [Myxococcales bacterium]|nr:hypothetical protein [Myxococcales bacterium]
MSGKEQGPKRKDEYVSGEWKRVLCCLLFVVGALLPSVVSAHIVTYTCKIPMRDGVALDVLVILPSEYGSYPTLILRTPYAFGDTTNIENETAFAVPFGSAVVSIYERGHEQSGGKDEKHKLSQQDAEDIMKWLRKQYWAKGKVTWIGEGYQGVGVFFAAQADRCLTSHMIWNSVPNLYDMMFRGGVFQKEVVQEMLKIKDEAGWKKLSFSSNSSDTYWTERHANKPEAVSAPMILVSGWHSPFVDGMLTYYNQIATKSSDYAKKKHKIVIGPWGYDWTDDGVPKGTWGDLVYPSTAGSIAGMGLDIFIEDWILNYILDTPGGLKASLAPVSYYLMGAVQKDAPGGKWLKSKTWPPASSKERKWYLRKGATLKQEAPTETTSSLTYAYDPKDPFPTTGGRNIKLPAGPKDLATVEQRKDVVLFTSDILTEDLYIAGQVKVTLWVKTDAKDTDFTAMLTDVYPDGRSMLISEGIVRLRYRNGTQKEEFVTPGTAVEVTIDLGHTAMAFPKGHAFRVVLSSSNAPRYQPNPNTGAAFSVTPENPIVANNTVIFEKDKPSFLVLPVADGKTLETYTAEPADTTKRATPCTHTTPTSGFTCGTPPPDETFTDAPVDAGEGGTPERRVEKDQPQEGKVPPVCGC